VAPVEHKFLGAQPREACLFVSAVVFLTNSSQLADGWRLTSMTPGQALP